VYDVTNDSSFQCMDRLKKQIERNREKKEVRYQLNLILHAAVTLTLQPFGNIVQCSALLVQY